VAPSDELTRQQIINERLSTLRVSSDVVDSIRGRAMEVVNATPAILLDLCDRLSALMTSRPSVDSMSPGPAVSVRQKLLDDAVAEARQRVVAGKDSMEACATKWLEKNQRDGLLYH